MSLSPARRSRDNGSGLRRFLIGTFPLLAVASCEERQPSGTASWVVRDSAGVRVVENTAAVWVGNDAWQIDGEPAVRIGRIDGDAAYQFYRIRAVDLTPEGGIIVLDGASSELRLYDARGMHRWSAGKQGGGPGEFQQPTYVGQQGDGSFLVWDRAAARLTVIGPGGGVLTTERHLPASGDPPNPYGVFASGGLLATFPRSIEPPAAGTTLTDTIDMWWYDRTTQERRKLATAPGPVWIWTGRYQLPVPFTANPLRAASGDRLVTAAGPQPAVRIYETTGRLTGHYILPREAEVVGSGDPRRLVEFWSANQYYGAPAAAWDEWLDRMSVPARRPAFDRLLVSRDGHVWARRFTIDPGAQPATWDVITPDGIYLGTVTTPADLELAAVGGNVIVGIFRDEDDVEYVHVHEIDSRER